MTERVRIDGTEFVITNGTYTLHGVLTDEEISGLTEEQIEALKQQKLQETIDAS